MTIDEFFNDLDVFYMDIESVRYDDNMGTSFLADESLKYEFEIANDDALVVSSNFKFIGAFNFKKYKVYVNKDRHFIITEDNKGRCIEIYLK